MTAAVKGYCVQMCLRTVVLTCLLAAISMSAMAAEPDRDALFLAEKLFSEFWEQPEPISCPPVGMHSATEAQLVRMCWVVPAEWVEVSRILKWFVVPLNQLKDGRFFFDEDWTLRDQVGGMVLSTRVDFLGRTHFLYVALDASQQHFIELRYRPQ